MRHDILTTQLYGGEARHTFCRSNVHRDPERPVVVEYSIADVIKGATAIFLYVWLAILVML